MLKKFFNTDKGIFRFCGKLADILMLSLLWLVCCIPVVTIGSASAALYNSASKCVCGGQNRPYVKFRDCFKENFKAGIPVSILVSTICLVLSFEIVTLWNGAVAGNRMSFMLLIAIAICAFVPLSFMVWLCAIFSRYEFTFGQLVVTAFKFVFAHLLSSIAMGVLMVAAVILCYGFVFPITFMPCLLVVINSLFIEKAFSKHS